MTLAEDERKLRELKRQLEDEAKAGYPNGSPHILNERIYWLQGSISDQKRARRAERMERDRLQH